MAKRHGNKVHYQVLLDMNRSALLEEHAAVSGVKPAALMRSIIYRYLRTTMGERYEEAALADHGSRELQNLRMGFKQSLRQAREAKRKPPSPPWLNDPPEDLVP